MITDGFIRRRPLIAHRLQHRRRWPWPSASAASSIRRSGSDGPIDLVADAPALAVAALVYLVVNDTLVAAVLSIQGRSFFQEWRLSFKDILLPYVSMAPLGALAAYAYQATPWALLYFPPLVLVVYEGFKLFVSLQRETDDALVALADSIDRRDKYTYEHSMRVAEHVEATARRMGLAPREADLIVAAARVHDLGKIATDNRVLLQADRAHAGGAPTHRAARRRRRRAGRQVQHVPRGSPLHPPPSRTLGRHRLPRRARRRRRSRWAPASSPWPTPSTP